MVTIPDELLIDRVCAILVGTEFTVADALEVLDRRDVLELADDIEEKIIYYKLDCCPLCERWAWNSPGYWNDFKGCCVECAELGG